MRGHPPELRRPEHQRVVQQPALLQVLEQGGGRLVQDWAVPLVVGLQGLVRVPVEQAVHAGGATRRSRAARSARRAPAAGGPECSCARSWPSAGSGCPRRRAAASPRSPGERSVTSGALKLHARRQFVGGDAGRQVAVAGVLAAYAAVEAAQKVAHCCLALLGVVPGGGFRLAIGALGIEGGALIGGGQKAGGPVAPGRSAAGRACRGWRRRRAGPGSPCRARTSPTRRCWESPRARSPVFIWSMAGPCVLLVAVSEWTKAMSSTHSARCGSRSETHLPHWPCCRHSHGLRIRLPLPP